MVITATTPGVQMTPQVSQEATRVRGPVATTNVGVPSTTEGTYCPRCDTLLVKGYEEPQCLRCGYADYTYVGESMGELKSQNGRSILSAATRYILRYTGDCPSLTDTLADVRLTRVRHREVFAVSCPFCEKPMGQSPHSGNRPEVPEQRYKCIEGHRVSLVAGKNDLRGWR